MSSPAASEPDSPGPAAPLDPGNVPQAAATQGPATAQPPPAEGERASSWFGVFLTTATTVFLAELGDKTQLAALLLSAESGRPLVVFVGASMALICSSLVGVLLGRWLSTVMAPEQLERAAGVLMVALGLWLGRQAVLNLAPCTC